MADCLVESMLAAIRRYAMVKRGEKVLVAVSGGPDSVALLHALWSTRAELDISLHVAHLNHSFRGKGSDADAEYVSKFAVNLRLDCIVEKMDVPRVCRSLRLSDEEGARMVRYEFLERVAADVRADRIALGHTADDQVETVLMNLLRGTGVDGLSGMPPVRGKIVRPLIETRRSVVEEYVAKHDLRPRTDETNLMPTFTRNKVRLELLPLLRREYNPETDAAILRLAELARGDAAYLNMESEEALGRLTIGREDGSLSLDVPGLLSCSVAVRRRLIRLAVRAVRGELADVGFIHVEELLRLLDTGSDFKYELPGGTFVQRSRDALSFLSSRPLDLPMKYCHELAVPGTTDILEIGVAFEAEVSPGPVEPRRPPGAMEAVLDYARVVGKLRVRNWESGDRLRPLGLRGSKKVQDVFVDAKIPRQARSRVPLVVDDEKVLWVVGLTLSELVKVTDATTEFLELRAVTA